MFDNIRRTNNITTNQQPNDAADSARLYGELLDKSRQQIIAEIVVKNNLVEDVHMQFVKSHSMVGYKVSAYWAFSINGKRVNGETSVEMDYYDKDLAKAVQEVYKGISEEIVRLLCDGSNIAELASMEGKWN